MKYFIFFLFIITINCFAQDSSNKNLSLFISKFDYGGVYIGGIKTPAKFYNYGISYTFQNQNNLEYGINLSYMRNLSQLKTYSGLGYLGYYNNFQNNWKLKSGFFGGLTYLKENSSIQDIKGSGYSIGAKLETVYKIPNSKISIGLGVNWMHTMFSSTYWGKDLYSDITLDFFGPTLSINFEF